MGGTPRKKDKPGPSYEEGQLRDPKVRELQEREANAGADQRVGLARLITKAARRVKTANPHL